MKLTKLSWSGVHIEAGGKSILIDPVEEFSSMEPYMGKPLRPVWRFSDHIKADIVLLTHLHRDHYDPETLVKVLKPGAMILVSKGSVEKVKQQFTEVRGLNTNETMAFDTVSVTALFSLDGIGDEQVAWLVESEGKKLFHAGDTIWHSQFWAIGRRYELIDIALLPINGVTVTYPFVGYTPLPASLSAEQAAVAGRILSAGQVVPMHYELFHSPGVYEESVQSGIIFYSRL